MAQAGEALTQLGQLGLGQLTHLRIVEQHRSLALRLLGGVKLVDSGYDRLQLGKLLARPRERLAADALAEHRTKLRGAVADAREAMVEADTHPSRSGRSAIRSSAC